MNPGGEGAARSKVDHTYMLDHRIHMLESIYMCGHIRSPTQTARHSVPAAAYRTLRVTSLVSQRPHKEIMNYEHQWSEPQLDLSEIITEKENQDNKGLIEVTIPER